MNDQWTEIADAIRSSDPDQVNEAIDRINDMDADERARLFDIGFDELTRIYANSDDGYVRQSTVRVTKQLTLSMVAAFLTEDGDAVDERKERTDTICGFLLETIQDEDGRVRQSTKRALKDVYRSYDALEDTETIAALATELGELAEEYEGKQRKHLLETKEDAEFFLQSGGARIMQGLKRMVNRSNDTQ
jgi:hypothetical protein